ncbi:MAG: hypothetical protein AAF607_03505 [Pseudomonadota bacterium]
MMQFLYKAVPTYAVFGAGSVRNVMDLVADMGGKRALFVASKRRVNRYSVVRDSLGGGSTLVPIPAVLPDHLIVHAGAV